MPDTFHRLHRLNALSRRTAVMLLCAAVATVIFVIVASTREEFSAGGFDVLLLYHAPIGFVFVLYAFDRYHRFTMIPRWQWLIELPLIALAVARALSDVPLVSGHALFLAYMIWTTPSPLPRWIGVIILVEVFIFKITFWDDTVTPTIGTLVGRVAAWPIRHFAKPSLSASAPERPTPPEAASR